MTSHRRRTSPGSTGSQTPKTRPETTPKHSQTTRRKRYRPTPSRPMSATPTLCMTIEGALRTFPADEVIIITLPDESATWLEPGAGEEVQCRPPSTWIGQMRIDTVHD